MAAKNSPANRAGAIQPNSKLALTALVANTVGKIGEAALGTSRFKMAAMMQQERHMMKKDLLKTEQRNWNSRTNKMEKVRQNRILQGTQLKEKDPNLLEVSPEGGQKWAAGERPKKPPAPKKGRNPGIKDTATAVQQGNIEHEQAMDLSPTYKNMFSKHIKAGGTEKNFISKAFTPAMNPRRNYPGQSPNNAFGGN